MKKVLIGGAVVLILVAAAAVWFVTSRLDSLVAALVERYGTEIAGTPVRVGSVKIDLRAGRGTIGGLRVANPEGYSRGDAFQLGEITLDIALGTLTSSPVVIDELVVGAPEVRFELNAQGRSNVQVIQANVDRYSAASPGGADAEAARAGEGEALRLRIAKFTFEDGRLRADVSAVDPDREPVEAELPPLRLQNVGGARGGTPAEIGKTVLGAFSRQVVKTAARVQAGRLLEEELGGEAGRAAGELLRRFRE